MYSINLKDPEQIAVENVRRMIASVDDSEHSQIRVSEDGLAYVEQVRFGEDRLDGVLFRSEETFFAGTGCLGSEAARDSELVSRIYEDLKELQKAYEDLQTNWPQPRWGLDYGTEEPYSLLPPMVDGYWGPYANWTELSKGYGGQKVTIEYVPDENGYFDLFNSKVHLF